MNKPFPFIITLLLVVTHACAAQNVASMFYGALLGNQDVCAEYKELTMQALQNVGVKNPENVSVKQMNGIGPAFARVELSSFTAYGIWLDEEYLASCSEEERLFHIYHEVAHYACNHHQKTVLGSIAMLATIVAGSIYAGGHYYPENTLMKYTVAAVSALAALAGGYAYVLPRMVRGQEKEADMLAAQTLVKTGKEEVVLERIKCLQMVEDHGAGTWWYGAKEQIGYLEELCT